MLDEDRCRTEKRGVEEDPPISRSTRKSPLASSIEKMENRSDKLRWQERFFQENAVGHTARGPAPDRRPGDVNDRKDGIDLSGLASHLPTVHPALQDHVGHQRSIFDQAAFEKCDSLFTGCCDGRFEAAIGKRVFNHDLNIGVVLDDQNRR